MPEDLRRLVAEQLKARQLSLRALARRAGVSHSAVSRLMSGASRPTPGLLRSLALPLGVPARALLEAAGLPSGEGDALYDALWPPDVGTPPADLTARVKGELIRLKEYAATDEARRSVAERLAAKVEQLGMHEAASARLLRLANVYLGGGAPEEARLAAGAAVLYFLQSVDVIGDYLWPVGYLDDALALSLVEDEVRSLLTDA